MSRMLTTLGLLAAVLAVRQPTALAQRHVANHAPVLRDDDDSPPPEPPPPPEPEPTPPPPPPDSSDD